MKHSWFVAHRHRPSVVNPYRRPWIRSPEIYWAKCKTSKAKRQKPNVKNQTSKTKRQTL